MGVCGALSTIVNALHHSSGLAAHALPPVHVHITPHCLLAQWPAHTATLCMAAASKPFCTAHQILHLAPPLLLQVGSVIRSPEMAALVPALLAAIADPNASTRPCLDTLLDTTFVNTIDAPSLALVVPVVHRGLRDRSGDTKKRAARIVGSMCTLTNDPKVRGA